MRKIRINEEENRVNSREWKWVGKFFVTISADCENCRDLQEFEYLEEKDIN